MRVRAVVVALVAVLLLAGCSRLGLISPSMTFNAVYPSPGRSDVTIHYSLPQAPDGKVYVLWVVNPIEGKVANVGTLPAGSDRSAEATVGFEALGAIVSVEDSASAQVLGSDWALSTGEVRPGTPTPSILDLTPTATPNTTVTPTAAAP